MMTNVELDVLEAVAMAATPHLTVLLPPSLYEDSWHVRDVDDTAVVRCYGFANEGNGDTARRLAEYIAAANPAVILELIAELRKAKAHIAECDRRLADTLELLNIEPEDSSYAKLSYIYHSVKRLQEELQKMRAERNWLASQLEGACYSAEDAEYCSLHDCNDCKYTSAKVWLEAAKEAAK